MAEQIWHWTPSEDEKDYDSQNMDTRCGNMMNRQSKIERSDELGAGNGNRCTNHTPLQVIGLTIPFWVVRFSVLKIFL